MKLRVAFFLVLVCITAIIFSCRRNTPSLVDANRSPDTELWYAPADSSEYTWSVSMYWRGVDHDGVVERYIWTIQDTLTIGDLSWNPAQRVSDLRTGRTTTRTDSVFSFTAFQDIGGVPLQKNRQAFYIASIDDNGVIDPSPAAIEFVATVGQLPQVKFMSLADRIRDGMVEVPGVPVEYDVTTPPDTVGMFRPFTIMWNGSTENGLLRGYRYRPLTVGVVVPGDNVWYPSPTGELTADLAATASATSVPIMAFDDFLDDDVVKINDEYMFVDAAAGDNLTVRRGYAQSTIAPHAAGDPVTRLGRFFENRDPNIIPSGVFRFAAQSRDDAGAESRIDAGQFLDGVVQVVVNFEPDTRFTDMLNNYTDQMGIAHTDTVKFDDAVPDTIPYDSWVTLFYNAADSPYDSSLCVDVDPVNLCIRYQIQYARTRAQVPGSSAVTGWLPVIPEDSNPFGTADSTSMNVGSVEYDIRVRSVDEYDKADGTPPQVSVVGNFDPTLEDFSIVTHDGQVVGDGDTLLWDFWSPANTDTFDFNIGKRKKQFSFYINGTGSDHPKEKPGAGVKSWLYLFSRADDPLIRERFARAGTWSDGQFTNVLADTFTWTAIYDLGDPAGDGVFANLPDWMGQTWDYEIQGRDIGNTEEFVQVMILNGGKTTINSYNSSSLGRWTAVGDIRFYLTLER